MKTRGNGCGAMQEIRTERRRCRCCSGDRRSSGYRHYADDVVYEFVNRAVDNGIDIIRVFNPLNDPRNMEAAIKAAKDPKSVHVQGALVYAISPIHTLESFTRVAGELEEMGVRLRRS